ncbi:MAG: ROK family glucokinase [Lachnospiraceae bacterium]|nr:ROK family glucokinase [Lachnospiraceae bacterium]
MGKYVFGIDVGGTSVKFGLFEVDGSNGNLIEKWSIPTRTEDSGSHILPDIADSIKNKISEKSYGLDEIIGAGIGLPGPVDDKGIIRKAVNLYWKEDFNVEERLSGLLDGMKVKATNDANAAALGEAWAGSAKNAMNVLMITLGTGVGGGIVINGKVYAGTTGAAGEVGHIMIERDFEEKCNCGNAGCLEQFASATGMVRVGRRMLSETADPSPLRERRDRLTAKDIWDAAKDGDSMGLKIAGEIGRYLGEGLAIIATVLNPEVIVIGGGVSAAGKIVLESVEKHFKKHIFHASAGTKIVLASLGNDGGIYGTAKLLID